MSNIDDFNTIVGLVFSRLYACFPVGVEIDSVEIVTQALDGKLTRGEVARDFESSSLGNGPLADSLPSQERDEAERLFNIYSAAMKWLEAEGFIRFDDHGVGLHLECALTLRGLQSLSLVPDGLKATLGDQIMQATKEGALVGVKDLAKKAISEAGGWLLRQSIRTGIDHLGA